MRVLAGELRCLVDFYVRTEGRLGALESSTLKEFEPILVPFSLVVLSAFSITPVCLWIYLG